MATVSTNANPKALNEFIRRLGVDDNWHLVPVLSLDEEALSWVPKPVLAVIMQFPLTPEYDEFKSEEHQEMLQRGKKPIGPFYLKQVLSNTCGTIAIVHSIANNSSKINLPENSAIKKYLVSAHPLDPQSRGHLLSSSKDIFRIYRNVMNKPEYYQNSSEPKRHFITFIEQDRRIYELDGRKEFPISHGLTSPQNFLEDVAKICQKFIQKYSIDNDYNILALVELDGTLENNLL